MKSFNVAKHYKPKLTNWAYKSVAEDVKLHKRRTRRAYKQYIKTGLQKDFDRSQRIITRWDFD